MCQRLQLRFQSAATWRCSAACSDVSFKHHLFLLCGNPNSAACEQQKRELEPRLVHAPTPCWKHIEPHIGTWSRKWLKTLGEHCVQDPWNNDEFQLALKWTLLHPEVAEHFRKYVSWRHGELKEIYIGVVMDQIQWVQKYPDYDQPQETLSPQRLSELYNKNMENAIEFYRLYVQIGDVPVNQQNAVNEYYLTFHDVFPVWVAKKPSRLEQPIQRRLA